MAEAPADLEQPTSSFHVGTCFANAQKGTYFDGTGFAKTGEVLSFTSCCMLMRYNTNFLLVQKHKSPWGPKLVSFT